MSTTIRNTISETSPYYISKHEYLMMKHFALQYSEWKKEKAEIETRIRSGWRIGDIHGENAASPVEKIQEEAERYSSRIDLIERMAKIAGEDIWEFVLTGVTTECSYEYLRLVKGIPCCKDVYYKMYRKFFWLLNRELLGIFDAHQNYNLLNGKPTS
jgi:hypothetical protein